jgi:CheY-like chemotaxis protein
MPVALILSEQPLESELGQTVLWRRSMERRLARSIQEAVGHIQSQRPDIIVVDHRFPGAADAVARLRQEPRTRATSIVALARGDFDNSELELLQAGANAILRLPPGADWDDRLVRLLHVPIRKGARLPANLLVQDSYDNAERVLEVTAINLSVNGILVESSTELAIGEDVHFTFHLPDSPEAVAGSGTVVRVVRVAEGISQFGVELTHVQGDGRVRIKRFVES